MQFEKTKFFKKKAWVIKREELRSATLMMLVRNTFKIRKFMNDSRRAAGGPADDLQFGRVRRLRSSARPEKWGIF